MKRRIKANAWFVARGLLALCVFALAAGAGRAQQDSKKPRVQILGDPVVYSQRFMPYAVVHVSISNPTEQSVPFTINLTSGDYRAGEKTHLDSKLDPGANHDYWIPLLGRTTFVSITLVDGWRVSEPRRPNMLGYPVLHAAPSASWITQSQNIGYSGLHSLGDANNNSPMLPAGTPPNALVGEVQPNSLPDAWMGYAAFTQVVIDEPNYLGLTPVQSEALLDWVHAGGELVVYNARDKKDENLLAGRIRYIVGNVFADSSLDDRSNVGSRKPFSAIYFDDHFGNQSFNKDQGFIFDTPKHNSAAIGLYLVSLFVIVGGPVNAAYTRRKYGTRALLVTTPVISIVFCLLMAGCFVVFQGFSRKGGTYALTLLDEANDSGIVAARHNLLSGIYPLGGFKFASSAAFYPVTWVDNNEYEIDLNAGTSLKSGIFKPSVPLNYSTFVPTHTREHLLVDTAAHKVTNGFETPIKHAVILMPDGTVWRAGAMKPGVAADLEAVDVSKLLKPEENRDTALQVQFINDSGQRYIGQMLGAAQAAFRASPSSQPMASGEVASERRGRYLVDFDGMRAGSEAGVALTSSYQSSVLYGVLEK